MYGIFTYMYHKNQLNVGKYTIHGWYGNAKKVLGLKSHSKTMAITRQNRQKKEAFLYLKLGGLSSCRFIRWNKTDVYLDVPERKLGSMVIGSTGYFTDPYKWGMNWCYNPLIWVSKWVITDLYVVYIGVLNPFTIGVITH